MEEIDEKEIQGILKGLKKYAIPIILICLFFLFYQLGFMYGFNQSFHLQENYYETKILKFCICQEKPHYNVPNKPLEIPESFINFSISNKINKSDIKNKEK